MYTVMKIKKYPILPHWKIDFYKKSDGSSIALEISSKCCPFFSIASGYRPGRFFATQYLMYSNCRMK
jgi:hypothetical protein